MICWCSDFPATLAGNEDDAAAASDTKRALLPRLATPPCAARKRRPTDAAGWLGTRAQFCAREICSLAFLPTDSSGFLVLLWEISMANYCCH